MKARNAMIAWTPADHDRVLHMSAGQVKAGPYPDLLGWSGTYAKQVPAGGVPEASDKLQALMVFVNFHTLVVRDGVDPQVAHRAFLVIDEYRELISPDIPGADPD